jgi:hypothetical protein
VQLIAPARPSVALRYYSRSDAPYSFLKALRRGLHPRKGRYKEPRYRIESDWALVYRFAYGGNPFATGGTLVKRLGPISTRRQLFRVMAAGAASVASVAVTGGSASAVCSSVLRCNCLLKGTRISTSAGERLVEELQIGDEVLTLSGCKLIKWIGYNKFTKEEGPAWQDDVMPVRVARSAIGDNAPHRDLYLSPRHYIYLNEVLIPVKFLINESSIGQGTPSDISAIEYYHIDLGTHEVIYADGALVDSYFDDGSSRENFSNFVQYERLYGVEHQSKMTPFAPMLGYNNARQEMEGLVRSLISNVVDVRDQIQIAYDQLAKRAEAMVPVP